jgi:hypothetical protein
MANIFDMVDVWNDAGTTFTSIKMNTTDTASNAASLLMDLQVGGVSQISIQKTGSIALNSGGTYRGQMGARSGGIGILAPNNLSVFGVYNLKVGLSASSELSWSSSFNPDGTNDVRLFRDAANTLAQRNGTAAQAFNLYNTYTDASNYERGFLKWNSNVLEIGTEAAGTGTARQIRLITSNSILKTAGGANYALEAGSYIRYASGLDLVWSNSTNALSGSAVDVGIARVNAGVLKITDGYDPAGTGQLIFIVPTTDPGITGALWNNAGTLAISA